jgi:hypothetical protein
MCITSSCIITVLIFSGVPDPKWKLHGNNADKIIEMISEFPETQLLADSPPLLGYRGFMLECSDKTIFVYKGKISHNNSNKFKIDKNVSLETFLLESSPSTAINNSLIKMNPEEISSR